MLPNNSEGTEIAKPELVDSSSSPTCTTASPPAVPGHTKSPPIATKGFGLKKWRRIRRKITKGSATNTDFIKMLKRGSANIVDANQPDDSGDPVSSTDACVQSPGVSDQFAIAGSSSSYKLPVDAAVFSAGADSDNSDDRSSKSSTAASAPKSRHDTHRALGHQREKLRMNKSSGQNSNAMGIGPRSQAGKSLADISKKPRGESIALQKENSHSSMESDSRSCNFVFLRGVSPTISNQVQNGRPINSDGENTCDEPAFEEQYDEELRAGCSNDVSLSQENLCGAKKDTSKNLQLPRNGDPLINSFLMLQSAHIALEREVQKFGEVGKGFRFLSTDSSEAVGDPAYPTTFGREACTEFPLDCWASNFNHVNVSRNVQELERLLSEAEGRLKEKELKIDELELTIKTMESCREYVGSSNIELRLKENQDVEAEMEGLFKQKIEIEVQYLVMIASTKDLKFLVEDQIKLLREQKEEALPLKMMNDVENNSVMLGQKTEQLDTPQKEIASGDEILNMQRRVAKFTKCLFIQLVLLTLVFGFFVLQFSPKSAVVVPT